ncbi:MAG: gamma carbonic anhydrase family protein [Planctomycetota bacterium]
MPRFFLASHGTALVACNATVVGRVDLSADVSVWYGCVLRGDDAAIRIGAFTNVQDLTVIHGDPGEDIDIGQHVTVGHRAMLHMRSIGDRALIGMGAILLARSVIGRECIIAAGALVPEGKVIPDRSVVVGVPGKIVRQVTDDEARGFVKHAEKYRHLAETHRHG